MNKINHNKKLKNKLKKSLKICDNCMHSSDVSGKPSFILCSKYKCIKSKLEDCGHFEFKKELKHFHKQIGDFNIPEGLKKLSELIKPKKKSPNKHRKELILKQKRGHKADGSFRCAECKQESNNTWLYKKTSLGSVYICEECKPKVFDRTRGRIDVLDMPHSGNFEGNPRKH